ncbi:hypothetical protein Pint_32085 [Pistacia integerrima]|uniref:Uncharacterized protein n=1 Tax=Pistacia integerrima TaxID=434235 RepID=A0ACC0XPY4_9ROSI|nr:hypothetical protein Pint_32085 [Pistacia integerrima]
MGDSNDASTSNPKNKEVANSKKEGLIHLSKWKKGIRMGNSFQCLAIDQEFDGMEATTNQSLISLVDVEIEADCKYDTSDSDIDSDLRSLLKFIKDGNNLRKVSNEIGLGKGCANSPTNSLSVITFAYQNIRGLN